MQDRSRHAKRSRSPGARLAATARVCLHTLVQHMAATWRSGYAADCKSVHAGSIPAVASKPQSAGALAYMHASGRPKKMAPPPMAHSRSRAGIERGAGSNGAVEVAATFLAAGQQDRECSATARPPLTQFDGTPSTAPGYRLGSRPPDSVGQDRLRSSCPATQSGDHCAAWSRGYRRDTGCKTNTPHDAAPGCLLKAADEIEHLPSSTSLARFDADSCFRPIWPGAR